MIHPTAIIEDGAVLGADCVIHAHALITRHAVLGNAVEVHPFAVIGGDPQDLGFDRTRTTHVRIGDRTVLREHVTINRATKPNGATEIGADCYLMATSHVAHDCQVGERVILANAVLLAGHVEIGARAFVGGGAAVHQFARIGEGAMISGLARMARDLAPFLTGAERDEVIGLNVVGLRRRGVPRESMLELKRAYHEVFRPVGNLRALAAAALAEGGYASPEALLFLRFLEGGRRGFARRRSGTGTESSE